MFPTVNEPVQGMLDQRVIMPVASAASATRDGRTIVAVVLHDANATADARRLLDLGFATAPS